jgi:hypothetical protein
MLPSSRRVRKNNIEDDEPLSLGDINRFYKKTKTTRGATDARDNSKIKRKYSKTKLYDNGGDNSGDEDEILSELTPSYIESEISNNLSSYAIEQEEKYESTLNNGLSIKKQKMTNIKYPFADKSSEHLTQDVDNIDERDDTDGGEIVVELLVYHINHTAYKPFLEFMLYKSHEDDTLYFPNFSQSTSNYEIVENASLLLDNLLGKDLCTFKGRIIESPGMNHIQSAHIDQRVILLYELTEKNDNVMRLRHDDTMWWGTVSEVFNFRKILFYTISDTVTDVFLAYPAAIKIYHREYLLETPMVVYNGNDSNTAKYNAIFSIKRANNESRYGPFYYFTDLFNAMRYACYDDDTGEKRKKGGLVKFVIYPGKMKVFMKKDKPDKSEMAKHIFSLNPIKKKTAQFRDNDYKWTEQYNSSYNGAYEIPIKKSDIVVKKKEDGGDDSDSGDDFAYMNDSEDGGDMEETEYDYFDESFYKRGKNKNVYYLAMRICIKEYNFQTPLSYYYIDMKDIPDKYEYDFKKYKII